MASPPRPHMENVRSGVKSRTIARREKPLTDREYADRVKSYARVSTGQHYHNLANYLFGPYQRNVADVSSNLSFPNPEGVNECFVTMYAFHDHEAPQVHSFSTAEVFSQVAADAEDSSALLFLRGHQSPELLNAIGAKYRVDPEFFRQHLSVTSRNGPSSDIRFTSLPSTCGNILRLPFTTSGSRSSGSELPHAYQQNKVLKIREETGKKLDGHVEKFAQGQYSHLQPGSSIVRNFSVHDYQHFSLEQEISVYVAAYGKRWVAIVWLDTGNDLGQDKSGPWQAKALQCESWEILFHPILQHRPGAALHSWHLPRSNTPPQPVDEKEANRLCPSAGLLHRNYGQHLDNETMVADPFYALTEVFAFVACSEAQFLDVIQVSLDRELNLRLLSQYPLQTTAALWNLVYNRLILDRHLQRLREIISFLEHQAMIVEWPTASTSATQDIASNAAKKVRMDYAHLVKRCKTLCDAFDGAMGMLQNNAMIDESHKAIQQAAGVAKLTRLAFFFIPLSFTASIFGMNIRQLNQGSMVSFWVWVVTSVVTLSISYLVLSWDNWHIADQVARWRLKREHRKPKDPETIHVEAFDKLPSDIR